MNIGEAVEAMEVGRCVRRAGWNGKGMFVYLLKQDGFEPGYVLHTATGTEQLGWNASTPDLRATDWEILEDLPNFVTVLG